MDPSTEYTCRWSSVEPKLVGTLKDTLCPVGILSFSFDHPPQLLATLMFHTDPAGAVISPEMDTLEPIVV
jgi:hypothetical protein